jgi:hypothetical protein
MGGRLPARPGSCLRRCTYLMYDNALTLIIAWFGVLVGSKSLQAETMHSTEHAKDFLALVCCSNGIR